MATRNQSEDSDEEFQGIQFERLHQEYRQARGDQREVTIEKKDQMRLQKKMLRQLVDERNELDKVFSLLENVQHQKRDEVKTKKLQQMLQLRSNLQLDIEQAKQTSDELDQRIRDYEKKIQQKLVETGGSNFQSLNRATLKKREKVLENRLDTTGKRFNATLSTNSSLRSEIDNLRNERERYETFYQRLEKELRRLRTELFECVEKSVISYEQRKEANAKAIILQNKAENDRITSEAEMKELDRQISHDRKLRQFMKLKAQERHEDEQLLLYRKRKENETIEKRRKEREEHSVEAYEAKFKLIQEISGVSSLEKLVGKFIEAEEKNFAMFNYVNELNSQAETFQEEIVEVKNDIERLKEQDLILETQRRQILEQTEQNTQQTINATKEFEEKTRQTKKTIDLCRTGIDSLFKKIGCDRSLIDHLLQSHEGVTEENILKYLGIIEERINELLMAQAMIQAKEQSLQLRDKPPNFIGEGPAGPLPSLQVNPPNTDDRRDLDDRDEKLDEELKPLTREELKQRAVDHITNLERKALQEQMRNNEMTAASAKEKAHRASRSAHANSGKNSAKKR